MRFSDLEKELSLSRVAGPAAESYNGVYAGDLLSRAMSHVQAENIWITIMSNTNVVAVASLAEASAVILAEDVTLIPEALSAAEEQGISVYSSPYSVYDLCVRIAACQVQA